MRRALVKLSEVINDVTKMVTEYLRAQKLLYLYDKIKKSFSKI